jgi:multiple sugar transport system substrate-binding protein
MQWISRRQLLKGMAAAGFGVVGANALAACAAPQAAAPAASEGTGSETGAAKTDVRWGVWSSGAWLELEQKIADAYNAQSETAQVTIEAAPWQQYWDKMQVSLAAGTAPDLIWMSGATFLNLVEKDGLLDLTDLISETGFNVEEYYTQPDIFEWQGRYYGMPWSMGVQVLYVNKTAFEEAGVELPPDDWNNPDWTWDAFLEKAQALTNGTERYGVQSSNGFEFYWGNYIWSNGGEVCNVEELTTPLDTPEAVEALKFAVDLIHAHQVAPLPNDPNVFQAGAPRPFALGKVAMDLGNNAYIPDYIAQISEFDWGLYPLPKSPKPDSIARPSFNGNPICIASKTQVPNEAFDALAFLSGKEGMEMVASAKLTMPALKSAASTEPYVSEPPTGMMRLAEGHEYAQDLRFTKYWLEWITAVQNELDRAFINELPIEEAAANAAREGDKILKQ